MAYLHQIRVRYNECDVQGIVFNANYLVYVDDTFERWMSDRIGAGAPEVMVKKATIEWQSSAGSGDVLDLAPAVTRWGTSSFDVTVTGSVAGRPVFEASLVYVNVAPGTHTPCPVRDEVRSALS